MDVEVLSPFFGTGRKGHQEATRTGVLFNLFEFNFLGVFIYEFTKIFLGLNEADRDLVADLVDLGSPLADIVKGSRLVSGDADPEKISALVNNLAVDAKIVITAGIVDLDLYHLLLHSLSTLVDIEYSRLVIFVEFVFQIVSDQARLSDSCIAHQDNLKLFGSGVCLFLFLFSSWLCCSVSGSGCSTIRCIARTAT